MDINGITFIRAEEAAKLLGVAKSTFWLWVKNKKAPAGSKISRGITAWKKSEIINFANNLCNNQTPTPTLSQESEQKSDSYSKIEYLAKKATQGYWMAIGYQVENINDELPDICICDLDQPEQNKINAEYIAAVQPSVILELIEKLRSYERRES